MNPEQSAPASGNNYDFIVNPGKPPKQNSNMPGSGITSNPLAMRVILVAIITVVVLFGLTVASRVLLGDKTKVADLVSLTQTQTEVVRIGEMGDQSSDQDMRNATVNARLVILTQRQELITFLAKHGRGVGSKELVLKKNKQTDTRLARAKQTSTFDTIYEDVMDEQLTAYAAAIKKAHGQAYGSTEKKLLAKHYDQTQTLIKQLPQ